MRPCGSFWSHEQCNKANKTEVKNYERFRYSYTCRVDRAEFQCDHRDRVASFACRAMNAQRERCVAELSDVSCASLVYGCLVAIMAQGPGEDRRVTAAIREQLIDSAAMPALVTSADALIEAIRALGAGRVALVTPYMKPIAQKVVDYIEAEHI
jgi:maleate cis-trans isomerase